MKERDFMSENTKAKMKALVQYAPFDNRYETVDVPDIGPEEILLRVRGCGICAGDIKAYHGGIRIWGSGPQDRYIEAPVIGGHEFYGEIVRTGEKVAQWKAGDVVCAEQIVPCGECDYCRATSRVRRIIPYYELKPEFREGDEYDEFPENPPAVPAEGGQLLLP